MGPQEYHQLILHTSICNSNNNLNNISSTYTNNENEITKNENFAKKFWQNFPLKTFLKFSPGQILCKVSISCFPSGRNSIICDSDLIKNFCQKTLAWKQQISKVSNKTLRKKRIEK